jgi:hypothetical protein
MILNDVNAAMPHKRFLREKSTACAKMRRTCMSMPPKRCLREKSKVLAIHVTPKLSTN